MYLHVTFVWFQPSLGGKIIPPNLGLDKTVKRGRWIPTRTQFDKRLPTINIKEAQKVCMADIIAEKVHMIYSAEIFKVI